MISVGLKAFGLTCFFGSLSFAFYFLKYNREQARKEKAAQAIREFENDPVLETCDYTGECDYKCDTCILKPKN